MSFVRFYTHAATPTIPIGKENLSPNSCSFFYSLTLPSLYRVTQVILPLQKVTIHSLQRQTTPVPQVKQCVQPCSHCTGAHLACSVYKLSTA